MLLRDVLCAMNLSSLAPAALLVSAGFAGGPPARPCGTKRASTRGVPRLTSEHLLLPGVVPSARIHLFLDRRPKDCLRVSRDRECLHLLREHHLILLTRSREARSQFPVVHSAGLWFPLIAKSVATMDPLCRPVYNTSKPAKMFCMKFASSLSETFSVDQKNNFARYRIPARMFY